MKARPRSGLMVSQCVILAGGGQRDSLSERCDQPWPAAAARPHLDHLIEEVARFAVDEFFVLAAGASETASALEHARRPARDGRLLTVTTIAAKAGNAAAYRSFLIDRLADTFFVINGHSFFDCNIAALAQPAMAAGRLLRLAVCRASRADGFAAVALDGDQAVRIEPASGDGGAWISAGLCYARKTILPLIDGIPGSLESAVLPHALRIGAVEARRFEGQVVLLDTADGAALCEGLFPIRRGAVFFDRDGVLNEDSGYVHRPDDLRWLPGAKECVRAVNDSGRFAFVVTNQSGVARGFYGEDAVRAFHAEMQRHLLACGAHIDAFAFCPHHPDGVLPDYAQTCDCRKPLPGMIVNLLDTWPVRREDSILIGDRPSDLRAAQAAGIAGRLYSGGDLRKML